MRQTDMKEVWSRYKKTGDEKAREQLVLAYSPLVKFVAGRMSSGLPAHIEESDLISYGLLGLIGAIERFDPKREIKFETFAVSRIKGSIIDELRSLDWVPRSVRAKAREIEAAQTKLEHDLGRVPTDQEVAESLDVARSRANRSRHPVERAELVDDRPLDPRHREGLELDLTLEVEPLDRPDQAEQPVRDQVPLLDVRRQPRCHPPGDELDQRRVGDHEPLPGALVTVLLVAPPKVPQFDGFDVGLHLGPRA